MLADRWLLRLFALVACAVCCSGSTAQESADRAASAEQGLSANAASAEQGLSANADSGERGSIPETTETSRPELTDRAALIQVRLPLVGSADQAIRRSVQRICDHLLTAASGRGDLRRPVLVIQLMPPSRQLDEVAGTSFERAYALARYLCSSELAGIRKVAFVPQTIRGHGTLLAMACEELIMAADAEIGEASIEKQE